LKKNTILLKKNLKINKNKNEGSFIKMVRTRQPKKELEKKNQFDNDESNESNEKPTSSNGTVNGLTSKQEAFVKEYLIDLNATQAAIRAGYKENAAGVVACQNLKKTSIKEAIAKEMELRQERTRVTQDKVVKELAKLAFSNMRSFVTWGPQKVTILDSGMLSEDDAACVMEVSETTTNAGGTVRFKLYNKKDALELLGRHLGMFSDIIKHTGEGGGPISHRFDFDDKSIRAAFDKLYGTQEKK